MGCSSSKLSLPRRLSLSPSRRSNIGGNDHAITLSDTCDFEPGARIVVVMGDSLVDATVESRALGDGMYNINVPEGGGRTQRELFPVGCCAQRFASAAAFISTARKFCQDEARAKSTVEDGITGNVLNIEDNLQYVTTENEAGSANGTFLDEAKDPIVDGSILTLSLAGDHAGQCLFALGPWMNEGEHKECNFTQIFYALRKGEADLNQSCTLRLVGPPSCCRLRMENEECYKEHLYMSCDTRMEEERAAFNLFLHMEDGLPPMHEDAQQFCLNVDGTISLHRDTLGVVGGEPADYLCPRGVVRTLCALLQVMIVGDTNLESSWPRSIPTGRAQNEKLRASPLGMLPKELIDAGPKAFDEALVNHQLSAQPDVGQFTTFKLRTQFQGQVHTRTASKGRHDPARPLQSRH